MIKATRHDPGEMVWIETTGEDTARVRDGHGHYEGQTLFCVPYNDYVALTEGMTFNKSDQSYTRKGKFYSASIKKPRNMQEGLANFVQMIINDIEDENMGEALYKAVDLLNDINSKANIYQVV